MSIDERPTLADITAGADREKQHARPDNLNVLRARACPCLPGAPPHQCGEGGYNTSAEIEVGDR